MNMNYLYKHLSKEQRKLSYKNHRVAQEHFGIKGTGMVMHHRDPLMLYNDPDRYVQWNTEDLQILTAAEHLQIHRTKYRNVLQLDLEGNVVGQFETTAEASRKTGARSDNMAHCLKGDRSSANGYLWVLAEDYKPIMFKKMFKDWSLIEQFVDIYGESEYFQMMLEFEARVFLDKNLEVEDYI